MINEGCFHCFVFTVNKNLQKKSFHENAHVLDSNSCTNCEGSAGLTCFETKGRESFVPVM